MTLPHAVERFHSSDVEISFRRFGLADKTPILIVHGLSYSSWNWIDVAGLLASDREIVAMDMRGFGDSSWSPSKSYGVPDMGADIANLAAYLGWSKAILMGHSMGGRNVAWCAANHPELAHACVLVDYSPENAPEGSRRVAASVGRQPDTFESVEQAMRYFGADPDTPTGAATRARYEAHLRPVPDGFRLKRDLFFRDQFRRLIEHGEKTPLGVDMWQVLAQLRCPTLVVRGRQSDMFPPENVARMAQANQRIRVVEIDGGHDTAGDNPLAFVTTTREFINSVS